MDISIIMINYKTFQLTYNAVAAVHDVMKTSKFSYEVIVVDNCSDDGSFEKLKKIEDRNTIVLQTEKNGGFSYGNNYGSRYAKGEMLFFLNSDTILYKDVLPEMIDFLKEKSGIRILSCQMVDGDGELLVSGHPFENVKTLFMQTCIKPILPKKIYRIWKKKKNATVEEKVRNVDWVSGAALLIPQKIFEEIGGWNETFFMYMEDEELCYRAFQRGYKSGVYGKIGLKHLIGKSGGSAVVIKEKYRSEFFYHNMMQSRWKFIIKWLLLFQANQECKHLTKSERKEVINTLVREYEG